MARNQILRKSAGETRRVDHQDTYQRLADGGNLEQGLRKMKLYLVLFDSLLVMSCVFMVVTS